MNFWLDELGCITETVYELLIPFCFQWMFRIMWCDQSKWVVKLQIIIFRFLAFSIRMFFRLEFGENSTDIGQLILKIQKSWKDCTNIRKEKNLSPCLTVSCQQYFRVLTHLFDHITYGLPLTVNFSLKCESIIVI